MGVWAYGRMGVWAYGRMGVWAYGRMGVWAYGERKSSTSRRPDAPTPPEAILPSAKSPLRN